jgi:PIN domain nuclease of toxin-antitoxin system
MLLDTNAFIWFLVGHPRAAAALAPALADPGRYLAVSLASFWEMSLKHRKGRLPLPAPFTDDAAGAFEGWCDRGLIEIVPIKAAHIARAAGLEGAPEDPFDRLIAATALEQALPMVTADRSLFAIPDLRVVRL